MGLEEILEMLEMKDVLVNSNTEEEIKDPN